MFFRGWLISTIHSPFSKRGENWVQVGTARHLWIDCMDSWSVNNDNMALLSIQSIHRCFAIPTLTQFSLRLEHGRLNTKAKVANQAFDQMNTTTELETINSPLASKIKSHEAVKESIKTQSIISNTIHEGPLVPHSSDLFNQVFYTK